jgi:hypothetical protein
MYDRLLKRLGGREHADSIHAASWVAIEFQAALAMLLLLFLAARFVSPYLAVPALLLGILALRGKQLTDTVLRENDSRFQTLLFYFIVTFAFILFTVGWSIWT